MFMNISLILIALHVHVILAGNENLTVVIQPFVYLLVYVNVIMC